MTCTNGWPHLACAGNDLSRVFAPLVRDGRMSKFYWKPDRSDIVSMLWQMYKDDNLRQQDMEVGVRERGVPLTCLIRGVWLEGCVHAFGYLASDGLRALVANCFCCVREPEKEFASCTSCTPPSGCALSINCVYQTPDWQPWLPQQRAMTPAAINLMAQCTPAFKSTAGAAGPVPEPAAGLFRRAARLDVRQPDPRLDQAGGHQGGVHQRRGQHEGA